MFLLTIIFTSKHLDKDSYTLQIFIENNKIQNRDYFVRYYSNSMAIRNNVFSAIVLSKYLLEITIENGNYGQLRMGDNGLLTYKVKKANATIKKLKEIETFLEGYSCKLCEENRANIIIGICGHTCCEECSERWFKNSTTCPYCRSEDIELRKLYF